MSIKKSNDQNSTTINLSEQISSRIDDLSISMPLKTDEKDEFIEVDSANSTLNSIDEKSSYTKSQYDSRSQIILNSFFSRSDPDFLEVIYKTPLVAVYKFINNEWHDMSVAGSLYLVSRNTDPSLKFVLMNKKKPGEFKIYLDNGNVEIIENFIIINQKSKIYGLWFYFRQNYDSLIEEIYKSSLKLVTHD